MKRAFTLIEMLVVSAIIAILAALLLPVLNRAKHAAQQSVCVSNVRQLNLAVHMYADEHGNELRALTNRDAIYVSYKESVLPYLGRSVNQTNDALFACPARPVRDAGVIGDGVCRRRHIAAGQRHRHLDGR